MKRTALALVLGLAGMSAYAQSSVKVNLVLHHVQNLTIHPDQSEVTLAYHTAEDYRNGVELVQKGHLTVFSTSAYEVKVRLTNQEFVKIGTPDAEHVSIPPIKVKATAPSGGFSEELRPAFLTPYNETIISSGGPAFEGLFDVTYQGPGGDELVKYAEKNNTVAFTNDILYSIETK